LKKDDKTEKIESVLDPWIFVEEKEKREIVTLDMPKP
jgi:hypothetical protein